VIDERTMFALDVLAQEATRGGYTSEKVRSSRAAELVAVRQRVIHRLRVAGYSLPEIGRVINRDHTTVLHHLEKEAAA
jgi:chromosomal replication initiation ATPase DnaA